MSCIVDILRHYQSHFNTWVAKVMFYYVLKHKDLELKQVFSLSYVPLI